MHDTGTPYAAPKPWAFALLFVLVCAVAALNIAPVDPGGDITDKWIMVRHLTDPVGWPGWTLDHQTARWALNFPFALIVSIFGPTLTVYYGVTIVTFGISICLLWLIWNRLFGWAGAALLLCAFALNPLNSWLYSHFLSDNLSYPYLLLGFYFLIRGPSSKNEVISGAFFFLAYAAKVTNLYFVPGIVLWLWFQRSRTSPLRFLGVLAALFAIETAILSVILGRVVPLGVVQAAMEKHISGMYTEYVGYRWIDTLTRWAPDSSMFVYTKLGMLAFFMAALGTGLLKALRKGPTLPKELSLTLAMGVSFGIFVSFAAISVEPFRPVQPLLDRYLWPLWPFALTYCFWVGRLVLGLALSQSTEYRTAAVSRDARSSVQFAIAIAAVAALLVGTNAWAYRKTSAHRNGIPYPFHLSSVDQYYRDIALASQSCRPIVLWHPKTLRTLDSFITPVGGPRWINGMQVQEMPRTEFLRSYAPKLIGVTDENWGAGENVYVVRGSGCPLDLCKSLIVGELTYSEQAQCVAR